MIHSSGSHTAPPGPPVDRQGRPLGTLRLSVTDRCNLRCAYCMPEEEYAWLRRDDLLSVEEMDRLAGLFIDAGVSRVRITGGEPLLFGELPALVSRLRVRPRLKQLALTTNGVLLADRMGELRAAGLDRLTISLDTLDPDRFESLTRRRLLPKVLAGVEAARIAGLAELKLDTVVMRGVNDDELVALLRFARSVGAELRFIEYMDVGGATRWRSEKVVSQAEMLGIISETLGPVVPAPSPISAPAQRFQLGDGTIFGIVASVTAPFCRNCDRSRLTADGQWLRCLYATEATDLRTPLRAGDEDRLRELVEREWQARDDRGAEVRAALPDRGALVPLSILRAQPHREMHTRGG